MELSHALTRYARALGRSQSAWRFAPPELRRAGAFAQISAVWEIFRRDAGPGAVGPAHEDGLGLSGITCTDDPRRDGVVLWLADFGAPPIAEAATVVARMINARRHLRESDQALLAAARDSIAGNVAAVGPVARLIPGGDGEDTGLGPLRSVAAMVDHLRGNTGFLEASGAEVRHVLPGGPLVHYVAAEPGAAWALNLALFAKSPALPATIPSAGLVSRHLFRPDIEPEDIAQELAVGMAAALEKGYRTIEHLDVDLARGRVSLAHLSRNARAADAWALLSALGGITRAQLARALGLSRAGADIQAHALARAALAETSTAGRLAPRPRSVTAGQAEELSGSLGFAAARLEASMAEIDRLLERSSR